MEGSEFKLLLQCCRSSFAPDAAREVQRLSTHVDWLTFSRLVRRHRVQGLIAQAFYKSDFAAPPAITERIADDATEVAQANLRFADASTRLREGFDHAAIPVLFVKGLSLSALAYGDPFVKMSADIDILIDESDLEASAELLKELGYCLVLPRDRKISTWHRRHKESVWSDPEGDVMIELHTRLADHPTLIPQIGMTSSRQEVEIGPGRTLPTLNTNDLITYLFVHGSSSAWFRLKWIVDVAALIRASGANLEVIYNDARRAGAGRAAAQALLLAARLSLLTLPSGLQAELQAGPTGRLLARLALSQLLAFEEPTRRPFGTATIHLNQLLVLPGWKPKLSELTRQAAEILGRPHRGRE